VRFALPALGQRRVYHAGTSLALALAIVVGCRGSGAVYPTPRETGLVARDGGVSRADTYRPVVEQPSFTTLYAISDVHGHYRQLIDLLLRYGLITSEPSQPRDAVWAGANATLVVAGDMINKGPASLKVIEAVMALEASARREGGAVVALLGNHEAEFLGEPMSHKFDGLDRIGGELEAESPPVDRRAFAGGVDARGAWIRSLPFCARIGSWFFSHAGDTGGATLEGLGATLLAARASPSGWTSPAILGSSSILVSRRWYSPANVATNLAALQAAHIVMGHDPHAFSSHGKLLAPPEYGGSLVKLDAGLGFDMSAGALLRVRREGSAEIAESLLPDGTITPLWPAPGVIR
jgi:hypothetical protein